jgi:stage V sporulation protein B
MPVTGVIDSILVINLLVSAGAGRAEATGLFGLVTGPINSIINMPVVITLSLSIALLPKVAECVAGGKNPAPHIEQSFKYGFFIGLLSALLLGIFAAPLMRALYSKGLTPAELKIGASLLAMGSISVLYVSILQTATSVLQAAGQAHRPALNLLYGAIFKVIFTLALLPVMGAAGAMVSTALCYGLTCILDVASMRKYCRLKLKVKEFLIAPLIAGAAFAAVGIVLKGLFLKTLPLLVAVIAAPVIASLCYLAVLFLLRGIRPDEISDLPGVGGVLKKWRARKGRKRAE